MFASHAAPCSSQGLVTFRDKDGDTIRVRRLRNGDIQYDVNGESRLPSREMILYENTGFVHFPDIDRGVHLPEDSDCTEVPSLKHQITKLDMSHNDLVEVPDWVKQMTSLRELNLSYNQISALPWEFANLKCLQRLSIAHNQVTGFPDNVRRLLSLQHFDCVGNGILEPEQSRIQLLLPNCNISF